MTQQILNDFTYTLSKEKYKGIIKKLVMEYTSKDKTINLTQIYIQKKEQNKGYGIKVMNDICYFADEHRLRIKLYPTIIFGSDMERLEKFYERFGFRYREVKSKVDLGYMTRINTTNKNK